MISNPIPWLLNSSIPTIRYLTLTRLLDRPDDDLAVQAAYQAIQTGGPVAEILTHQTPHGNWANEHSFYTPKYTSTH